MYTLRPCKIKKCTQYAILEHEHCLEHLQNKDQVFSQFLDRLLSGAVLEDIYLEQLSISSKDVYKITIFASKFKDCYFESIDFSKSHWYLCFFDNCTFINCRFNESVIRYSIFGGNSLKNCSLMNCELTHDNFIGSACEKTIFDDSDLYYSHFNVASLIDCSFRDCNLKRVDFSLTKRKNTSFKYSNYEEAIFE